MNDNERAAQAARPSLTYVFTCPICEKLFKSNEPGEPMCTGPSETRDDHEMVVMHLKSIDRADVNPVRAEKRAESGLIMPNAAPEVLQRDSLIMVSR